MIVFIVFMVITLITLLVIGFTSNIKGLKWAAFGPVALIILAFLIAGIKIMDSTEIGVVKTFGKIRYTISEGLNIVNPITDSVSIYDLKIHTKEAQFMSYSKDAQPLTATIETQFCIDPDFVMEVARVYGTQNAMETKLANIIEERAKIVFSRYSAMELLDNRSRLSAEVEEEMTSVEELFHITFTSAIIRDIDFSDAFEAAVEKKMIASQQVLEAEQEKQKAIIEAEKAKEVAEIAAEQKRVVAQGEADALQITRAALEAMPDTYIQQMWLEKWDGKLPQIMNDGANLMLTPSLSK